MCALKGGKYILNFVFVSPQFPKTYWNFCDRLKRNGVNVLGIGDSGYDEIPDELKECLTEYYRVDNMENYDEMLRAMGFFTFKYGRIDWVESNNEYWLEQDARLRTDFNITTGIKSAEIEKFKRKSMMKTYYQKAGIPTARWCVTADVTEAQAFAKTVGWPVIAKPDNGVGANGTHKFKNKTELNKFFQQEGPNAANYILEEFVDGEIVTFDGVADANAEPIYAASHVTPDSIMEIAHGKKPMWYYVAPEISPELRKMGEAALKAFCAKSRFFHLEFFRLKTAKPSLGNAGDILGLEVNMRPAGGYTPDMINYANSADCYQIWADMVCYDEVRNLELDGPKYYCVYAGRRDCHTYKHSHEEILARYGRQMKMCDRVPDVLSLDMGNQMYVATLDTATERDAFVRYVQEQAPAQAAKD